MWHLLGDPAVFHVLEVGAGDGALAQAIVQACGRMAPRVAEVRYYVAADYEPRGRPSPDHPLAWDHGTGEGRSPRRRGALVGVQRVKTAGLRAFRKVVGCRRCHALIDNVPVHRFAIRGGRVKEVFVTLAGGTLTEVLDEPSSPRLAARLTSFGVSLPEGYRGEVNLAMEDWTGQLAQGKGHGVGSELLGVALLGVALLGFARPGA
jgi:SAM-dependent MidA family methyltransferase